MKLRKALVCGVLYLLFGIACWLQVHFRHRHDAFLADAVARRLSLDEIAPALTRSGTILDVIGYGQILVALLCCWMTLNLEWRHPIGAFLAILLLVAMMFLSAGI